MQTSKEPGLWRQIRRQAREWRDQWNNRNLYSARGKLEPFVEVLQTRYGYTRADAEKEFHRRIAQFEAAQPKHKRNAG